MTKQINPSCSDNGPQFVSNLFEEACNEFDLIHERIPPKTPNKNAYIESYPFHHRT
ncbi:hypothetical protein CBW46_013435 [Paenibacillus xerothermodurans]|uniref:Integrase catalytic domain-containing protein n=1 Tax=Paenibacillus xerothermodurans TaxID=1977292 RepID=A0A2W1NB19_PAEXE|nr:hypothetical protein CBW46_013435 [Paenibacillus xerothermodurans]